MSFLILELLIEGKDKKKEWRIASGSRTAQEDLRQERREGGATGRLKSDEGLAGWEKIKKKDL